MFANERVRDYYHKCLDQGFCKAHTQELSEIQQKQYALSRKALLFIRLGLLDPILYRTPWTCSRMECLVKKTTFFHEWVINNVTSDSSYEAVFILDSVAVFTLCYFSKICCPGALFKVQTKNIPEDPEIKFLYRILYSPELEESDITGLDSILQQHFKGNDFNLIRVCYISTLLFVRSITSFMRLTDAIEYMDDEKHESKDLENYVSLGKVNYQKKKYSDAINIYSLALKKNRHHCGILAQRAELFLNLGKYRNAQIDSYLAVIINPYWYEGYYVLSSSLYHLELFNQSLEVANYGLSLSSGSRTTKKLRDLVKKFSLRWNKNLIENDCDGALDLSFKKDSAEYTIKKLPELIDASDSEEEKRDKHSENQEDIENFNRNDIKAVSGNLKNKKSEIKDTDTSSMESTKNIDINNLENNEGLEHPCFDTIKKNKQRQKRTISENEEPEEVLQTLDSHLKAVSEALLEDCSFKALHIFRGPLKNLYELLATEKDEEFIVVCKYIHGLAYSMSGGYEELLKSSDLFKEIVEKHDIVFPAAYYSLGLVYKKLHRFKEALPFLHHVLIMLEKGIHCKVYSWPGTSTLIKETKASELKIMVQDLIQECETPPPPNAFCRYSECEFIPGIYYSDPNFKGYASVSCSEFCCVCYHVHCWKNFKTIRELTDKDFLETPCVTPDCEGIIIKIQHIDKKGDVSKEFIADIKKTAKLRWARWEKKADTKDKKRKKSHSSKSDSTDENLHRKNWESKPSVPKHSDLKNSVNKKSGNCSDSTNKFQEKREKAAAAVVNGTENSIKESARPKTNYVHDSKFVAMGAKNSVESPDNPSNNLDTIDHFDDNGSTKGHNYSGRSNHFNSKGSKGSYPVFVKNSTTNLDSIDLLDDTESQMEHIYLFMAEFLNHTGPLSIEDRILRDELNKFEIEAKDIIDKCGGIGEFLKKDMRFGFVDDTYVCVAEHMAEAYKLTYSMTVSNYGLDDFTDDTSRLKANDVPKIICGLNPDAAEYLPSSCKPGDSVLRNSGESFNINRQSFVCQSTVGEVANNDSDSAEEFSSSDSDSDSMKCDKNDGKETVVSKEHVVHRKNSPFLPEDKKCVEAEISHNFYNMVCNFCEARLKFRKSKSNKYFPNESAFIQSKYFKSDFNVNRLQMSYSEVLESNRKAMSLNEIDKYRREDIDFEQISMSMMDLHLTYQNTSVDTSARAVIRNIKKISVGTLTDENMNSDPEKEQLVKELKMAKCAVVLQETRKKTMQSDIEAMKKAFEQKEDNLTKENKQTHEKLKKTLEKTTHLQEMVTELKSAKMRLEKEVADLMKSHKQNEKSIKDRYEMQEKQYLELIQKLENENEMAKCRAVSAEIQILDLKLSSYIKKIGDKVAEAKEKIQSLSSGINLLQDNNRKVYLEKVSSYINQLNIQKREISAAFEKQIAEIKKGTPLKDFNPIAMPEIPEIPVWKEPAPIASPFGFNSAMFDPSQLSFNSGFGVSPFHLPAQVTSAPNTTASTFNGVQSTYNLFSDVQSPFMNVASLSGTSLNSSLPETKSSESKGFNLGFPFSSATKDTATITKPPPGLAKPSPSASLHSSTSSLSNAESIHSGITHDAIRGSIPLNNQACFKVPTIGSNLGGQKTYSNVAATFNPPKNEPAADSKTSISEKRVDKNLTNFSIPDAPVSNNVVGSKLYPKSSTVHSSNSSISSTLSTVSDFALPNTLKSQNAESTGAMAKSVKEPPVKQTSEARASAAKSANKNSYEKLLNRLKVEFPACTESEIVSHIIEFRKQRHGKLSGLAIDDIILKIGALIKSKNLENKKIQNTKSNLVLVNKKLVPDPEPKDPPLPAAESKKKKSAWDVVDNYQNKAWAGSSDNTCVICCEDMSPTSTYKVQCGHSFHSGCIRQWLQKKSDCPICRVLLLLPEEYPSLS